MADKMLAICTDPPSDLTVENVYAYFPTHLLWMNMYWFIMHIHTYLQQKHFHVTPLLLEQPTCAPPSGKQVTVYVDS